jgi:alpha-L-fucosidase
VNEPILNGWFWSASKRPKTASQLIDIFYQSVGRNGNMLMNLSPDTRGLIPENQLAPLREMAQVVDGTFAVDLAARAKLTADSSNPTHRPALAMDGNLDSWWEAASGATAATLTLTLPSPATFDVVSLQEAVDHRGQRIESFAVEVWDGSAWTQADQQTTVGYKRLLRLKAPVTTGQVRIRITSSRLEPALAEVGLFRQAAPVPAPGISERDATGAVTLTANNGCTVVYTVDGAIPSTKSPVYRSPIALPRGGTVQGACLGPNGRIGMIASKYFAGLAPAGWKVVDGGNQEAVAGGSAANAIDGSAATVWQTQRSADASLPHRITVDMGRSQRVAGFVYLPRQDGDSSGVVERYRFETSVDGRSWTTNIESGRFGNIRNNPVLQETPFAPVNARFFRLTALGESDSEVSASAAEISVLPSKSEARR